MLEDMISEWKKYKKTKPSKAALIKLSLVCPDLAILVTEELTDKYRWEIGFNEAIALLRNVYKIDTRSARSAKISLTSVIRNNLEKTPITIAMIKGIINTFMGCEEWCLRAIIEKGLDTLSFQGHDYILMSLLKFEYPDNKIKKKIVNKLLHENYIGKDIILEMIMSLDFEILNTIRDYVLDNKYTLEELVLVLKKVAFCNVEIYFTELVHRIRNADKKEKTDKIRDQLVTFLITSRDVLGRIHYEDELVWELLTAYNLNINQLKELEVILEGQYKLLNQIRVKKTVISLENFSAEDLGFVNIIKKIPQLLTKKSTGKVDDRITDEEDKAILRLREIYLQDNLKTNFVTKSQKINLNFGQPY